IGGGKEQPLDAKIATPNGWKLMGDMKIGDEVFGEDGNIHNVIGVFPQGVKTSYRITFSDGTSTECGLDHLWHVQTRSQRDRMHRTGDYTHKVLTLKDIMLDYQDNSGRFKYSIPTT